jgi:hypothetical protein
MRLLGKVAICELFFASTLRERLAANAPLRETKKYLCKRSIVYPQPKMHPVRGGTVRESCLVSPS